MCFHERPYLYKINKLRITICSKWEKRFQFYSTYHLIKTHFQYYAALWLLLGKRKKNFPLVATSNLSIYWCNLDFGVFVWHAYPEAICSVSLVLLQAFPSQSDNNRLICNGLSHFLKWFHRYLRRKNEGFSALLWAVWHHWNQMLFFQQKAFDYNHSFCDKRCQK